MNLLFRFFLTLLFAPRRSRLGLRDTCSTAFRVLPNDLDVLLHMNNGRYFSLMDLGRIDMMVRAGVWQVMKREGMYPVVASELMRFRRSLALWQKFELRSRLVAWDEKFVFLEQAFWSRGELCALALVKARILRRQGPPVAPEELLRLVGFSESAPPLPEYVREWQNGEQGAWEAGMPGERAVAE